MTYSRYGRANSTTTNANPEQKSEAENEFIDLIRQGEAEAINLWSRDQSKAEQLCQNWEFIKKCALEVMCENVSEEVLR